jgi:hypothetical protein
MFSLWGNLQEAAPPGKDDRGRYFYATTSGQILSADGSGYVIPDMGKYTPEQSDYIPKEVAMDKVKEVLDESKQVRETYEQNLQNVEAFYTKMVQQSKDHYEAIIHDLKSKAVRHVEVQRLLKQQMEDKLTKELQHSEHELEELRDTMATRNLQYKEEVRGLKSKISESEQELIKLQTAINENSVRFEVQNKMDHVVNLVEKRVDEEERVQHLQLLNSQISENVKQYEAAIQNERQAGEEAVSILLQENQNRQECQTSLQMILSSIEVQDLRDRLAEAELVRISISNFEERIREYETEISQKSGTISQLQEDLQSLSAQTGDVNQQLVNLRAEHDGELARIAAEREETIAHLKAKANSVLKQMKQNRDRAEVEVVLLEVKEKVYERAILDLEDSHRSLASSAADDKLRFAGEERQQHETLIRQLKEDQSATIKTMKGEMKKVLDKMKADNQRLLVKSVLDKTISAVVERQLVESNSTRMLSGATEASGFDPAMVEELKELREQLKATKLQLKRQKKLNAESQPGSAVVPTSSEGAAVASMPASLVQEAPVPVEMPAATLSKEELESLARWKARVKELNPIIQEQQKEIENLFSTLDPLVQEREAVKNEIKQWTKEFKEANNREPEVADKAQIRDKFQKYKVTSSRSKELEANLEGLKGQNTPLVAERDDLKQKIEALKTKQRSLEKDHEKALQLQRQISLLATTGATQLMEGMKLVHDVELIDQEVQVNVSELRLQSMQSMRMKQSSAPSSPRQSTSGSETDQLKAELEETKLHYEDIVEKLEDNLYAVREQLTNLEAEHKVLVGQKSILQRELDELIQAKRTDVIKRMEDDIKRLSDSEAELSGKVTSLTTEKLKMETRVKELRERAEKAEQELRDRDARELAALNPLDEKAIINKELQKQRDTAIQKAKAATAGWDAAANADEKLDLEVQKSYQKGIKEERERHANDLVSINKALEAKEQRITDLLVSVAEMEKKMHENDIEKEKMRVAMDNMKLEVADAIAAIDIVANANNKGEGGESGGMGSIGPSEAELDAAREQLDLAQEELVSLQERCDRLESELELARKKNRIFEKYAAVTGLGDISSGGNGGDGGMKGSSGSDYSKYNLDEAISEVRKAINKGSSLWKSNRKDDCYDVYLDACGFAAQRVYTEDLSKPLRDSIEHGKAVGAMNKQKGAIFFRKGLDKFIADASAPSAPMRVAEEEVISSMRAKESAASASNVMQKSNTVAELINDLNALDDSLLAQGYTRENNPTVAPTSPRGGDEGENPTEKNSSLYQRAKAAEAQVASLKKQMASIIAATAANTANVVYVDRPAEPGQQPTRAGSIGGKGPVATASVTASIRSAAAAGGDNGKSAAEVRKLQRKIKELEAEIAKLNASGGGGGANNAEFKALQQNEKVLQKKLKDADAALKRETKSLEMRATKAENALQKIQNTYDSVVSERDTLRTENNKLITVTKEIAELRHKAEMVITLEETLTARNEELTLLQEQFKKESQLRKKYKNELEDLKGAIRVYARCRPMAHYEIQRGCKQVVQIKDDTSMKVTTSRGEKEFEFDAVFSPTSTQEQVFEDTKRLVESCLDGFNVCVFAYGQTGSGKTHTMTGNPSNPGLTPKAVEELFRLILEKKHCQCKISTYFIELYNDNLVDLYWILDNGKVKGPPQEPPKLDIKLDAKKMVTIRNAVIKDVSSPDELMDLFMRGNAERHTGATKMNAESSRSHSIFAIMVESYDTTTKRTTMGKLSLVDLAGSERADKTGASAERLKEAQNINKSLSALGDVIAALSEGNAKFIPYRNNKLTQLMQDSLGGNAKTLMFVNFSPADYNADETTTSLMYAARVKKIVNNASKQAESEEVARLRAIIRKLQSGQQVAIEDIEGAPPPAEEDPGPPPEDDGKVYDGY